jgi:DNA-binding NarL/FixJ family response regulator
VPVVAFVTDLMDRSKVQSAVEGVTFARDPAAAAGADVVIVDLARFADAVPDIRAHAPEARIVAFGSHVDAELLQGARDAGADAVLPRSQFFRDPAAACGRSSEER